jgi:hypothetical protein
MGAAHDAGTVGPAIRHVDADVHRDIDHATDGHRHDASHVDGDHTSDGHGHLDANGDLDRHRHGDRDRAANAHRYADRRHVRHCVERHDRV